MPKTKRIYSQMQMKTSNEHFVPMFDIFLCTESQISSSSKSTTAVADEKDHHCLQDELLAHGSLVDANVL